MKRVSVFIYSKLQSSDNAQYGKQLDITEKPTIDKVKSMAQHKKDKAERRKRTMRIPGTGSFSTVVPAKEKPTIDLGSI